MITSITYSQFTESYSEALLIDVRSPAEYLHAHIPGARSLPLFTNEERKIVGTAYKQESREKAIKIGLKYFGPKMAGIVEQVEKWCCEAKNTAAIKVNEEGSSRTGFLPPESCSVVVHCWRGGMRSAGVAWLLDLYGFKVYTIKGGYKSFRHWCLAQMASTSPLQILGGFTGSHKTELLQALQSEGQSIIDLEGLANHKGSAFGNINMPPQPTQEQFENNLATAIYSARLSAANTSTPAAPIWLEDESQRIGDINIPAPFFKQMRKAPLVLLDVPFENRLQHILSYYGKGDTEKLVNAVLRIQQRLGGLEAKNAVQHLMEGDRESSFRILLRYYDKWYQKNLDQREQTDKQPRTQWTWQGEDVAEVVSRLINMKSANS